ncbi:primase-helicase family protein [Pararhodospirillum oryzae]|uniref:NrS-1 polymerase-like helicase domain-containing protein n=1 Tax=Pararhodospirillum oryzae TaxID=478448 RepID=A0A512H928_9PROT|nr:primase-helicase family protein [Pararhodospirillum oryzae]GEO81955.1 hypothetical protein ROR02_20860 [Pararhodospirillum oryzae]
MSKNTISLDEARRRRNAAKKQQDQDPTAPLDRLNETCALVIMGSGVRIVRHGTDAKGKSSVSFLTEAAFTTLFGNETVVLDKKPVKTGQAWLEWPGRRTFEGITFAPGQETPGHYNLWRGFAVEPCEGDCSLFLDHLRVNVCAEDPVIYAWVVGWFAQMVQDPMTKPGTALVLRGGMGAGKTIVGEVIGSLFPHHYRLVDSPRYVTGQFNAHMADCLFLQVDEGVWAGDKTAEGRIKGLITSSHQMVEQKGVEPVTLPNLVRLLITSNEGWVVPAGKEERRFCVLDMADHAKGNHEYFGEMLSQLENGGRGALLKHLLDYDYSQINLRQPPRTVALDDQKIRSMPSIERWWMGRLVDGAITRDVECWPPSYSKRAMYDDYIKESDRIGERRRASEPEFWTRLRKIMPSLEEKRIRTANGERERHILLPDLETCRDAFRDLYGLAGDHWSRWSE